MFFFSESTNSGGAPSTFSERLRAAREKAGISGKELASIVGIKYHSYMSYENQGREPKQETLVKIAAALNITTDALLGVSARQVSPNDDIEPSLSQLQEILQKDTANYKGQKFDERDRKELSSRVQDFAERAEELTMWNEFFDDNTPK